MQSHKTTNASPSDTIVNESDEARGMCDWALSVFGRISFSSHAKNMRNAQKGFIFIDLDMTEIQLIKTAVTKYNNAGRLVDTAKFIACDAEESNDITVDVSDESSLQKILSQNISDKEYTLVVRLTDKSEAGPINKCIRWVHVTDEVL